MQALHVGSCVLQPTRWSARTPTFGPQSPQSTPMAQLLHQKPAYPALPSTSLNFKLFNFKLFNFKLFNFKLFRSKRFRFKLFRFELFRSTHRRSAGLRPTRVPRRGLAVALALLVLAVLQPGLCRAQEDLPPQPWCEDAGLNDVIFLDRRTGWAVGDRGVLWHTQDGGGQWVLQHSGVNAKLMSVSFLDRQRGWIVGKKIDPYTGLSEAVFLVTNDGGRHWKSRRQPLLPGLQRVGFFDASQSWAVGEPTPMFPSGVFVTDGAGHWKPLPGTTPRPFLDATFLSSGQASSGQASSGQGSPRQGCAVHGSGISVIQGHQIEPAKIPPLGNQTIRSVAFSQQVRQPASRKPTSRQSSPRRPQDNAQIISWAVGDGAMVLRSLDLGKTWRKLTISNREDLKSLYDFQAVAAQGNHCWIAGTPGARILHSGDGGRTWQWQRTPSQVPIRRLFFLDARRGWAVGALGTVLSTSDGGQTWRKQRAGGTRLAVLVLLRSPEQIPLSLLARESGNNGHLSVTHLIGRSDLQPGVSWSGTPVSRPTIAQLDHLIVGLGGCEASEEWQFSLPPKGLEFSASHVIQDWDDQLNGRSLQHLEQRLVRQIRLWRPDLVITTPASPERKHRLDYVLNQVVLRASEQAVDPTRYPQHKTLADLRPWRVKKVVGSLGPGNSGDYVLDTSELATRLGDSLAGFSQRLSPLIRPNAEGQPTHWSFQVLASEGVATAAGAGLMAGIAMPPGEDGRRRLSSLAATAGGLIKQSQLRRNVVALFHQFRSGDARAIRLRSQLGPLLSGLPSQAAGAVLFHAAREQARLGQWQEAAETYQYLLANHQSHPACGQAGLWLVQYYSSGEVSWQLQRKLTQAQTGGLSPVSIPSQTAIQEQLPLISLPEHLQTTAPAELSPQQTRPTEMASTGNQQAQTEPNKQENQPANQLKASQKSAKIDPGGRRAKKAANVADWLARARPGVHQRPELRLPLAVAETRQGLLEKAKRTYLELRPLAGTPSAEELWGRCAAAEQWLLEQNRGPCPKPVWRCRAAEKRPHLDGSFDDPLWREATPITLSGAPGEPGPSPAAALMAYDDQFLYLGISCQKVPGLKYSPAERPRTRDPDLHGQDRVCVWLDIDRDWTTAYQLTLDHRGWVIENCWGDVNWNPRWFVAQAADESQWSLEIAIPLQELTGQLPRRGTAWAVGVTRVIPQGGFQSWTHPASPRGLIPGFGLLLFQ